MKFTFGAVLFFLLMSSAHAQITPPGLGDGVNASSWFAVGVKQDLNAEKGITSTTYAGMGSINGDGNDTPFGRAMIYVINQEIEHHFAKRWKYSGAISYRWQNQFDDAPPYDHRQEIRLYGRYSYLIPGTFTNFSFTFRPELRLFYTPEFDPYKNKAQFRTRFASKMTVNLSPDKSKRLIAAAEFLIASNKEDQWDAWQYRESRFSVYYSHQLPNRNITLNLGYMSNPFGKDFYHVGHYIAFDITLRNPFGEE
ncbi:DUF2490 domain-containing protein [Sinomicrobium soli]|uniref:DUF2490 domain-containing protein n=1 Tax=Sinomicrobium sp. N-1-3-6 TaxID=2219864 RepID=UPI0013752C35|nr:DUF2490 domain-containing protein [Sinomicrobium sp. N-1-3-6]